MVTTMRRSEFSSFENGGQDLYEVASVIFKSQLQRAIIRDMENKDCRPAMALTGL
jgi:hypothetical protein